MKKVAAILLIALLFFNWYGYRIVITIMAMSADRQLEAQLDNNDYEESELIELRVPLNVPYQNDNATFVRHYGEIEVNGKYYTYVKRKVEDGYLVLKCISNSSKQKIKAVSNDFFKMTNGLAQDQPGKKQNTANFAKNFWSEYDGHETDFNFDIFSSLFKSIFPNNTASLANVCLATPSQPPEAIVA